MSSQTEDTLYAIHTEVTQSGLKSEFDKQLKKMSKQSKHKWKTVCEKWEYAYSKVKKNNGHNS